MNSPGTKHRLVVELKRPSLLIGDKELTQVRSYARALSKHAAMGASKWTFWLVGGDLAPDIDDEVKQTDRALGHVHKGENYDIWVTHWGQLLDDAMLRYEFYREQLKYDIGQDEATSRVRERHAELLPSESAEGTAEQEAS